MKKKENTNEWRTMIINHYSKPINKKDHISDSYLRIKQNSNLCVDNFEIGMIIKENKIIDTIFNGIGCSISIASIDIMIEEIKNYNIKNAIDKINNFLNMINKKEFNINYLGKLIVFSNINKQPSRINCASIGINGILKLLLDNYKND